MKHIDSKELLNLFSIWYSDGLRSLNYILGHAEYLLLQSDSLNPHNDEHVTESLEDILRYGHLAKDNWQNAWDFLILKYDGISPQWQAQQLDEVINKAISDLATSLKPSTIQVNIPQNLPLIKGNEWVARAVGCFFIH